MKIIRINYDGTMNDIEIDKITKKNALKVLNKNSVSKGTDELKELYRWKVAGSSELSCYGWCEGHSGFENKHDLPPSGISDFIDDEDSSDKKLLFGDIFILLSSGEKFKGMDVSSYANYYDILFDGFDDCVISDDELSEEELEDEDKKFINDGDIDEESDDDSEYTNSIEELDIDENEYTDDDSDYNEECEGNSEEEESEDEKKDSY
jgi:hypothetical protein